MGIKEQTVSVHIRGSYRYRRAPCNRNRRSKHASVSFPLCVCFLSFRSFAPLPPLRYKREKESAHRRQEVITYVFTNYAILRVIMWRKKSEERSERAGGGAGGAGGGKRRKKEEEEEYCPGERSAVIISRGEVSLGEKSGSRCN